MTTTECRKIYEEAYRAVYWTAMSLLKNEADAEDVVQDTFVTMLESYDTLEDKTKVVPWLKKICANKCLNILSRTKTEQVEQEFFENYESVPEDFLPESIVESKEKRKIIMDIIENTLSEDVRRTIILFYFDEMSTKEIAEAMGIPQGTVLWRLGFARKKIKKEVERYEKENDTKLYAVALPFLTLLFMKEAELVPIPPMSASLAALSASKEAALTGAGKNIVAKTIIQKGTGIAMKKLIILCVGLLGAGAAIVAAVIMLNRDEEPKAKRKGNKTNNTVLDDGADSNGNYGDYDGYDDNYDDNYGDYDGDADVVPTIDVNNYNWESIFKWDGTEITGFNYPIDAALKNTGILVIPEKCETIGTSAFGEAAWVKEVRFEKPEKIKMIKNFAFDQFSQLRSFVMPPNANLFQDGNYFQDGTSPFGNNRVLAQSTKLRNLVLPNGKVTYYLLNTLTNYFVDLPANNQIYLERLFVPANFSIRYNDPERDNPVFAKYTEAYYKENWSRYDSFNGDMVYAYRPCKVYVVQGSWADEHFAEWTGGDLVQKEYWDGVNYTFAEEDPLWDVRRIRINIGQAYTTFNNQDDGWEVDSYNAEREHVFEGKISPQDFEALYSEAMALVESGRGSIEKYAGTCIEIVPYGYRDSIRIKVEDNSILEALIAKYAK
ncbi:MAG: sigma-70 family RNA polymerase sigma factor [Lachnospiraceae bacterium]|nr:sigma-70 family RNA polymerase sigma factor [Lachnospiraceae bacterium]